MSEVYAQSPSTRQTQMLPPNGLHLVLTPFSRFALFFNLTGFVNDGCSAEMVLRTIFGKRTVVIPCPKDKLPTGPTW